MQFANIATLAVYQANVVAQYQVVAYNNCSEPHLLSMLYVHVGILQVTNIEDVYLM